MYFSMLKCCVRRVSLENANRGAFEPRRPYLTMRSGKAEIVPDGYSAPECSVETGHNLTHYCVTVIVATVTVLFSLL